MGEEKGWAYMDALHNYIAAYTHSGSEALQAGRQANDRAFPSSTAPTRASRKAHPST